MKIKMKNKEEYEDKNTPKHHNNFFNQNPETSNNKLYTNEKTTNYTIEKFIEKKDWKMIIIMKMPYNKMQKN